MSHAPAAPGTEPSKKGIGRSAALHGARRLMRLAFALIRPRRLYEPVEIGGRRYTNKREAETRWAAIADTIQAYEAKSILDVGCAEAWFLRRAAAEFGCFGIGVEAEYRRVLLGELARLHDGVERVAVMKARLTPDDIRELPQCDLVLCLSVVHHIVRQGGMGAAEDFLRALATRARKAIVFEMGTAEEIQLRWSKALPEMPGGQEEFVRNLLSASGLTNIRVIADTPSIMREATRLLFVAEPPPARVEAAAVARA